MRGLIAIGTACVLAACGKPAPSLPMAKVLSAEPALRLGATWSPDGKRIAWWEPSGAALELWVGNADFSAPQKLPVIGFDQGPVAWSPDGTLIAVVSQEFSAGDVVVVPAAGGPARRVTQGPANHSPGIWNKDGDRLTVIETAPGGIIRTSVVSVSTGNTTPLVPLEKHSYVGAWSPDGSRVAYVQIDGPKSTIWVADSAGNNPRQLTTEGFEAMFSSNSVTPWSPDGKELLYESRRTGTSDLWVVPIDGSKPRQLTRDVRNDYNGSWSSDGKWVAFISDRGRQQDVWVVPSAGGVERRVTDTPAEKPEIPLFRPGTLELTFAALTRKTGVWAVGVADGKERRLTPDSLNPSRFNVSPDGKQFAFVIERGGGIQDLAVMPMGGGPFRTLVAGGGSVGRALWSPDGSKIAFGSDRGGTNDIWIVDAAGGAPKQLENWPSFDGFPTWAGDGSWLYFLSDRESRLGDVWKVAAGGGEPVRVTHDGGVIASIVAGRRGVPFLLVNTIGKRAGVFTTSRMDPDGSLHPIWEKSSSNPVDISPQGDSVYVSLEGPDGKKVDMIFPARGGAGRLVLTEVAEGPGAWSPDGKSMIYSFGTALGHIGVLNLADGRRRQLTNAPGTFDRGAEWTPDGKSIVFRRGEGVMRIYGADLTKFLAAPK
jgi:Tol biopolymer transport system component